MKKLSHWGTPLYGAILRVLIGCVLIALPSMAVQMFGYVVGAVLIGYGLVMIVNGALRPLRVLVVAGVLVLFLGGVAFLLTDEVFSFVIWLLSLFILVRGVYQAMRAWRIKKTGNKRWLSSFLTAVVVVLVGIFSLIAPSTIRNIVVIALGVVLFLDGVEGISQCVKRKRSMKSGDDGRIYVESEDASEQK
ncbi:MAG: DUF308 domain-containing protein [Clostridia bacterium]|nr:DUF308 domain-containing protein [Clostridia bacterium]